MLCVTTPWDPITARAKMDFMEKEYCALATVCEILSFDESRASRSNYYSKALNLTKHSFGKLLKVALYDLCER